jgi:hypothetical protein
MAGEQEEAVRTASEFEIRLVDGEELYGSVDGEEKSARGELAALHERLIDETFVSLGGVDSPQVRRWLQGGPVAEPTDRRG